MHQNKAQLFSKMVEYAGNFSQLLKCTLKYAWVKVNKVYLQFHTPYQLQKNRWASVMRSIDGDFNARRIFVTGTRCNLVKLREAQLCCCIEKVNFRLCNLHFPILLIAFFTVKWNSSECKHVTKQWTKSLLYSREARNIFLHFLQPTFISLQRCTFSNI